MNIIVTDKCTNSCPYCFATTEMNKNKKERVLSRKSIGQIIKFIKKGEKNFNLNIIGGEPFIYNDLSFLLEKLQKEPNLKKATLFTGGIFPSKKIEQIIEYSDFLSFLFNLNEKKYYRNLKEYELVIQNIAKSIELGFKTNIGFNIFRKDFDYNEILDICVRFGIENLRWTIACPQLSGNIGIEVINPSDYSLISDRVFDFLQRAYSLNINAYLDCPIPKCFFNLEQLGRIALIQPKVITALNACKPVIDITPDLTVFRCFATSEIERKELTDFINYDESVKWFEAHIDEQQATPRIFENCKNCDFAQDRTCLGGCLASSPKSIKIMSSTISNIERAYQFIIDGDLVSAEKEIANINRSDASISLLLAYLNLYKGDEKNAKRYAYMTINRSETKETIEKAKIILSNYK